MINETYDIIKIENECNAIFDEFFKNVTVKQNDILVLGCSTSEIAGGIIGKESAPLIGDTVVKTLLEWCDRFHVNLAVQCCEHLNRALVVEYDLAQKKNLEIVSVVPKVKAGGSAATVSYSRFKNPVAVEFIKADLGIDIGNTFIGMHLKHVAVPVRLSINKLGNANINFAKTRPKYIGGERACYK